MTFKKHLKITTLGLGEESTALEDFRRDEDEDQENLPNNVPQKTKHGNGDPYVEQVSEKRSLLMQRLP